MSAANAADVYARGGGLKDAPAPYMPAITWTGFYVGLNAGAAFNADDNNDDSDAVFAGGGHVGYNWQRDSNWVFGIEGDIDGIDADDVNYVATIRGRLGWAAGPALFYATGGVAFLGLDDNFFRDDTATGYVVGAGLDYKLRENWSVGVEGLYYNFEDNRDVFGFDDNVEFWNVRARLTYHFGGDRYAEPLK
jgi:outer membrane immunogenic protein